MKLKFGHRVIGTRDFDAGRYKGKYISACGNLHSILVDGKADPRWYSHVELDPDATEFLRGDKVEFSQDGRAWRLGEYAYKSIWSSVHYDIDCNPWKHCRYPRKDALHGKTAIIDGKEYELKLR